MSGAVTCNICDKPFSNKANCKRHMKEVHKLADSEVNKHNFPNKKIIKRNKNSAVSTVQHYRCLEPSLHNNSIVCNQSFKSNNLLVEHLTELHAIPGFETETIVLENLPEFLQWKADIEETNKCSYVLNKRRILKNKGSQKESFYYRCHRSGTYDRLKSKKIRLRRLKRQGSCKLNFNCTSNMIVTKTMENIIIKWQPMHYGHTNDLRHIRISEADKIAIASKLIEGETTESILESQRDNITPDIKRIDLITSKDIQNIKTAYWVEAWRTDSQEEESRYDSQKEQFHNESEVREEYYEDEAQEDYREDYQEDEYEYQEEFRDDYEENEEFRDESIEEYRDDYQEDEYEYQEEFRDEAQEEYSGDFQENEYESQEEVKDEVQDKYSDGYQESQEEFIDESNEEYRDVYQEEFREESHEELRNESQELMDDCQETFREASRENDYNAISELQLKKILSKKSKLIGKIKSLLVQLNVSDFDELDESMLKQLHYYLHIANKIMKCKDTVKIIAYCPPAKNVSLKKNNITNKVRYISIKKEKLASATLVKPDSSEVQNILHNLIDHSYC